ncbi:MAG: hypothetical protein DMG33_05690, partial [Acidobacteria bacterium]
MRTIRYAAMAVVILSPLAAAGQSSAGAPAAPTIDQSLEWKNPYNPQVSPDGRRIVNEVQRTNWEGNAFERELWIADAATGERHQLTQAKKSSSNAAWSRDGKWIAFLSDRPEQLSGSPADKKQIYVIAAD